MSDKTNDKNDQLIFISPDARSLMYYFIDMVMAYERTNKDFDRNLLQSQIRDSVDVFLSKCCYLTLAFLVNGSQDLLTMSIKNHDNDDDNELIVQIITNPMRFKVIKDISELQNPF